MTLPEGVMLPNELERRQIFYSLKRWSSYTAWKRMLTYYQAWADAAEISVRQASMQGLEGKTSVPQSDYVLILNGLADFEEGVSRLGNGDKRVFQFSEHGEFVKGSCPLDYWPSITTPMSRWGDMAMFNHDQTPNGTAFERTLLELSYSVGECWPDVIQPHHNGALEHVSRTLFNDYLKVALERMIFPDPPPEVPDPAESVLVATHHFVKHSGIWEPVETPAPKLISLFKQPPPTSPFRLVGTMAYLHGGTNAPRMACRGTKGEGKPCTWRLLWKDDRYEDGSIPDEEKHDVFLQPGVASQKAQSVNPGTTTSMTVAASGQKAPKAGRWLVEDDLHASVDLHAGDELPLHEGRKVRWVLAAT